MSFKVSLVYILNSGTAGATSRDAVIVLIPARVPLRKARLHFLFMKHDILKSGD